MSDVLERLPRPDEVRHRLRDNLRERYALRRLLRLVADLAQPDANPAIPERPQGQEVSHGQ